MSDYLGWQRTPWLLRLFGKPAWRIQGFACWYYSSKAPADREAKSSVVTGAK